MPTLWSPPFTPPSALWAWPASRTQAHMAACVLNGAARTAAANHSHHLVLSKAANTWPTPETFPSLIRVPGRPDASLLIFADRSGVVLHGPCAHPAIVRLAPNLTRVQILQAAREILAGLSPWSGTIAQAASDLKDGALGTYWCSIAPAAEIAGLDSLLMRLIPGLWGPWLADHCGQMGPTNAPGISLAVLGATITAKGRLTAPIVKIESRPTMSKAFDAWIAALGPVLLRWARRTGQEHALIGQRAYAVGNEAAVSMHTDCVYSRPIFAHELRGISAHTTLAATQLAQSLGLPDVSHP